MARITIDDCLARIPNRFELTLAATNRARQITAGSAPLLDADRDKPTRHRAARNRRRQGRHRDAAEDRRRRPVDLSHSHRHRTSAPCRKSSSSPDTWGTTCRRRTSRSSSARSSSPRPRTAASSASPASRTSRIRSRSRASCRSGASTPQALAAALLHDVMEDTSVTKTEIETHVRQARRRHGRRRLQARPDRVRVARGRAGRELPQDAARDGARRARHPDQARRPPAQHAHARRDGADAPQAHRARDARHLRADRQPPRPQRALPRAAGPVVQAPVPDALPHARAGDQDRARQPPRGDEPAARRRSARASPRPSMLGAR